MSEHDFFTFSNSRVIEITMKYCVIPAVWAEKKHCVIQLVKRHATNRRTMNNWFTPTKCSLIFLLMFPQHHRDDFVSLKRTACYGECPVFEVTVRPTERVVFLGERFVNTIGRKEYSVNQNSVKHLSRLFGKLSSSRFPKIFRAIPNSVEA